MKPVKKKIEGWGQHEGVDYGQTTVTAGCTLCGKRWEQTISADGNVLNVDKMFASITVLMITIPFALFMESEL